MKKKKGRPPLYETPEQLQAAVDEYFKQCEGIPLFDKYGYPVMKRSGRQIRKGETPPTLAGLSFFLGFKNRKQFTRQKNRSAAFRDVVSLARLRVECFWEEALYDHDSYRGAAFMLSLCFGWRHKSAPQPVIVQIINRAPKAGSQRRGSLVMQETSIELLN